MNNERSLFPPLFRKVDTGGGSEIREKIAEIDSEITDINSDITDIDSAITRLSNNVGNLSNLDTTDKSSLVGAVNEVASAGGGLNLSTTETVIGTYDGKPLYTKILRGLVSGWNSADAFKIPIAKLVYGEYQISRSGTDVMIGAFSSGDYKISTFQFSATDGIYISLTGSGWNLGDVIIAYTKTTD